MRLADRIGRLEVESAFDVFTRARALEARGRHVIHLELGEPDFATPTHIVEAAKRALDDGWTHYGPPQGLPEFREAIADHVSRTRGVSVGPQNVCVVPGAKPVLFFTLLALVEAGDEVLYPDPGFPIYRSMIEFLQAKPVAIPLEEHRAFSLDLDQMREKITDKTRLIILNSPENPTGGVIPAEQTHLLAEVVRDRDLMILSDEIYRRMDYTGNEPFSIASVPGMLEKTVIMDGFSKTYAMTGWRLGYGVMPERLASAVNRLIANSNTCTASFTQRAGIAALTGPQTDIDNMVSEFRKRRDVFCSALDGIPGIGCAMPQGAFYAFANVRGSGLGSKAFADLLLEQAGVAALDGSGFGKFGEGYLRFSYANSLENLEEAVRRIRKAAESWAR